MACGSVDGVELPGPAHGGQELVDEERARGLSVPPEFLDTRETTLEDIFIFHYGEHHQKAALENAA